jgi:hypothetical protein
MAPDAQGPVSWPSSGPNRPKARRHGIEPTEDGPVQAVPSRAAGAAATSWTACGRAHRYDREADVLPPPDHLRPVFRLVHLPDPLHLYMVHGLRA